jgi:hypothetical protein
MPAAAAALSKEEQELFEQMQKDDGKPAIEAKADKPKEEVKPDAKGDEKKEESKVVPLQALHEAREQNKELRKEMEAMKAALSDGDKRLKDALAKIEAKADAGPTFDDNPAAHLKHENAELKKGLAELQQKMSQKDLSDQQDGKMREHAVLVATKEQAFAKQHADYFQASEHVATLWREEFSEAGFDESEIPKLVFAKALGITNKAVQAGRDPAEAIYKIAKKYGFSAKGAGEESRRCRW